jgi:predicted histidine transporter YuiF (NhaC family)
MNAVPYIVLTISFIPYFMLIGFIVIILNKYDKERKEKEKQEQLDTKE